MNINWAFSFSAGKSETASFEDTRLNEKNQLERTSDAPVMIINWAFSFSVWKSEIVSVEIWDLTKRSQVESTSEKKPI